MITKITLRNFKSHKYTTLNLDDSRLHAIVGQNSSGKTSILQALHYLSQLAHRPFSAIFQSDREAEFLARSGQNQFDVTAQGYWGYRDRQDWTASFTWEKQTNNGWSPSCCWALDSGKDCRSGWSRSFQEAPFPIPQAIGQAVYLKLVANNLARAAYSDDVVPRVEYDGSGLAPTLDYLRGEDPEVFEQIVEMLRRVVPGVRGLDVRRAKVEIFRQRTIEVDGKALPYEERREITGQEVTLNMSSGERIPAHAVSEGTMLTLGLLTVLFSPRKPNLILLDDIEQGLHPHAQRALVGLLQQILDENRNLQILFTTHSPYIIDELMPSQVHVLNSTDQGYATTSRLDEHPDAEWASQTLTTGEFWDAEGESWVTGSQTVFEFIIIVESAADFRTAKTIAERLITEKMPWLAEYLANTFTWSGLEPNTEFSCWRDIRTIREALKAQGFPSPRYLKGTGKSDGAAAHIVLQLVTQLKRQRDIRAVLFIRDSDNQDERRVRLEQAREERKQSLPDTAIVIGIAETKREAWVLNGFVALDESEESLLADLRQRLSFDPTIEAHRLRATTADEPERIRNAKIVLNILTQENQDRESLCWQSTPLDVLRERGQQTGLTAYIVQIEERLIPILQ